jgi:hypothetical protein
MVEDHTPFQSLPVFERTMNIIDMNGKDKPGHHVERSIIMKI